VSVESFHWSAFRPSFLRALRDELQMGPGPAELMLAEEVPVPDENFVHSTWAVLRERWLATEGASRRSVVEELRAKGLGDHTLPVGTAAKDVNYLRSCHNSSNLRAIVLAHLLAAGGVPERPPRPSPTTRTPATVNGAVPIGEHVAEDDWKRFSKALALSLAQLEIDQVLVLEARRHPGYYVQFGHFGPAGLKGESVSNLFLKDFERLDPDDEAKLGNLGWSPPGDAEATMPGPPNWHKEWRQPVPYPEVAELASSTLHSVYEVPSPAYLCYHAFERPDGSPVILPNLGIVRSKPAKKAPEPQQAQQQAALTWEAMLETVRKLLSERTGVADLAPDENGVIQLGSHTTLVNIVVQKSAQVVSVFAPLVWGFGTPPDILATVNELNAEMLVAKVIWSEETVLMEADAPADPFDGEAFWNLVNKVVGLAADKSAKLQQRYGGQVPFGPALPPKSESSAGYL
jgi:hypothetical protein